VRRLAILSFHTSPLAQPGTGDGGGMNVYVRELASALARRGAACDVFTRATASGLEPVVDVEPGFRVHHVTAGPEAPVATELLVDHVDAFADGVARVLEGLPEPVGALHANYWLSGIAAHRLKHELDLPLVSTFHTLARVKAAASPDAPPSQLQARGRVEAELVACSDAVLASCAAERDQLVEYYGADPARVMLVAPGVEHAYFGPGDRVQARRALQLPLDGPVLLFVGRLQPAKGAEVAIRALEELSGWPEAVLLVVGGPSGPEGEAHVQHLHELAAPLERNGRVRFVGPQPHELLATYYRAADVCIVPSRSESFGLVALEAAACGTPVVASAVGGLATLVEHGTNGFLVEGFDPADYAAAVGRLLASPVLARRMSLAAAVRARRFTWRHAAVAFESLLGALERTRLVECG
jgi:D-inositol-3-phosphate glycosyltransferase